MSILHGFNWPTISIVSYLERILKYANCSPSCFIRQPLIPINSFNVHRLLIASVLVSAEFMDDMSICDMVSTTLPHFWVRSSTELSSHVSFSVAIEGSSAWSGNGAVHIIFSSRWLNFQPQQELRFKWKMEDKESVAK
ncbi:hypothetical protein ACS0TY_025758 [Phlomoides rotata]